MLHVSIEKVRIRLDLNKGGSRLMVIIVCTLLTALIAYLNG